MTSPSAPSRLDRAVMRVVDAQMCTGCGLCTALDPGLRMEYRDGFMRPARRSDSPPLTPARDRELTKTFKACCPGVTVSAPSTPPGAERDATLGPVLGIWTASASDAEIRHIGSSGGVLTALNQYLITSGRATKVLGAAADPREPRRTVPVTLSTKEDALAAAGSRYAPVSALSNPDALSQGTALTGKPCEASALRAYAREAGIEPPVIMSFFCAGTPSQQATDSLVADLGIPRSKPLSAMWYRGRGWPGEFTAFSSDGTRVSTSYNESWGAALGPAVQWRCRVCVDGVGEAADISAGDFWEADEKGYPEFENKPGRSVLIARTPRGLQIVQEAARVGVITIDHATIDAAKAMQPYQRERRRLLLGRLAGTRLLLGRVPLYRGFGLLASALRFPRESWRELRGTITRVRDRQRKGFRS